ncbi:MAG TPA: hypothetical protein VNZ55_00055, partial [Thermomicrobiales bacterium]|nr:hypothetical protein [Thermomicrobiales bacterium]
MLVRKDELACRNSWGSDLWVSATAPDSNTPDQPAAQLTEDIVIPPQKLDDVIESVVASDFAERPSTPVSDDDDASAEDVVVGEASLVPEQREPSLPDQDDLTSINTAAHNDQEHRAQVIARGSLDAILQARERVQRRRGAGQRSTPHAEDSSDVPQPVTEDVRPDTVQSRQVPANQEQRSPLERQRVQFGRAYNDPTPPVPVSETRGDERDSGSSGYDADIFDSVPEIDPAVELPHIDEATRRRIEQEQAVDELEGSGEILPEEQLSSYDLVLQRARAIRAAARAERDLRSTRGGAPHKSRRQTGKRAPLALPRHEQPREATARPLTLRPVEDVPAHPKMETKASLPTGAHAVAAPEVEDHPHPGSRFDMNLLITPDVSFRRQRRADSQAALDTPANVPVADELDTSEESVLPVPRRVPFFRRWKSPSARDQEDELPFTGTVSDVQTPDEVDIETQAESQGWDVAASHIPDDEPIPALDEPAVDEFEETGQAMTPVSEDVRASFGSGHPRDLYGYRKRQEDISSSRERRDDDGYPASPEPASSHWTRSDYRIRASRHAESPTLPDIGVGEDGDYRDLDAVPPVEDRYVLPLAEDQESTGGSDWSASWSFEPQTNLREADAMDAFRARLFG